MSCAQLIDEFVDETTVLEEEFALLSKMALTKDYIAAREKRFEAFRKDLRENDRDPEQIRRLQRKYRIERRRMFAYLLHRSKAAPRKALCLSGGGIRSATFSLGVVQWLGSRGLLREFDYLSTVSGGGYLGSWLTAWIHRHPQGIEGVEADLAGHDPDTVVRLREYSNYLAPKFGLLTADTWTLAMTYLRNLGINWLAFLPFLAGVISAPQIVAAVAAQGARTAAAVPYLIGIGLVLLLWVTVVIGLSVPSAGTGPLNVTRHGRPWIVGGESAFLVKCFLPFVVSGVLLTTGWYISWQQPGARPDWISPLHDRELWTWVKTGAAFHVLGMMPALLRVIVLRVKSIVEDIKSARISVSFQVATGFLREASHIFRDIDRLNEFFLRVGAALFVCGGVGGALICATLQLFDYVAEVHFMSGPLFVMLAPAIVWAVILTVSTLYVMSISSYSTDFEREWYARAGAWVLIAIASWLALTALSFYGPRALLVIWERYAWPAAAIAAGAGLIALLGGGSSSGPERERKGQKPLEAIKSRLPGAAAPIFLAVVFALLALGMAIVIGAIDIEVKAPGTRLVWEPLSYGYLVGVLTKTRPEVVALAVFGAFTIAGIVDWFAELGVFSLHALYRDRLMRAYLAASRVGRRPNPFTGIDPNDNLPLVQLRPGAFGECDVDQLAAVLRNWLEHDWWKARQLVTPGAPTGAESVRTAVLRRVARGAPAVMWRIARTTGDVDPDDERVLLQEFNTLLAQGDLRTLDPTTPADAADIGDPVLANRRYLESFDWFRLKRDAPAEKPRRPKRRSFELPTRLFPVINTALNLVRGDELAWQQRKAESFAFTPLHAGASSVGYRRSVWCHEKDTRVRYYGGEHGISVGTAMTISGAAANPNMGYHSSPAVTFLLTLFNARLGTWLGNPTRSVEAARRGPKHAFLSLLAEAFGQTNRKSRYLNLSDGGHFENLGVYEMVRRRCGYILVVDAGQDGDYTFDDLGNAINKVRVDFGVSITFGEKPRFERMTKDGPAVRIAVAEIHYPQVDRQAPGVLVYVKPALSRQDPMDVLGYASDAVTFPHETTSNQFFTERQFESYRMLGWHTMQSTVPRATTLEEIADIARRTTSARSQVIAWS